MFDERQPAVDAAEEGRFIPGDFPGAATESRTAWREVDREQRENEERWTKATTEAEERREGRTIRMPRKKEGECKA